MSAAIVPLRRENETQSALARVDIIAAKRLASGEATNLQLARADVILADLQRQRDQLAGLVADLRGRKPSDGDEINAKLITAVDRGLIQIDLFIAQAQRFIESELRP